MGRDEASRRHCVGNEATNSTNSDQAFAPRVRTAQRARTAGAADDPLVELLARHLRVALSDAGVCSRIKNYHEKWTKNGSGQAEAFESNSTPGYVHTFVRASKRQSGVRRPQSSVNMVGTSRSRPSPARRPRGVSLRPAVSPARAARPARGWDRTCRRLTPTTPTRGPPRVPAPLARSPGAGKHRRPLLLVVCVISLLILLSGHAMIGHGRDAHRSAGPR